MEREDPVLLAQALAEELASLLPRDAGQPDPAQARYAALAARFEAEAAQLRKEARGPGDALEAALREEQAAALQLLRRQVHADAEPLCALSISGGGIRSATFALGAVQALSGQGLMTRFDYLSTVSGGGYLGGWLSAWCQRSGGMAAVTKALNGVGGRNAVQRTPQAAAGEQIDPVGHLRDYNSYLSPSTGLLSTDTWALAATILRNMVLNWLVLLPLLAALLLLPRVLALVVQWLHMHPLASALSVTASFGLLAVAIFSILRFLPEGGNDQRRPGDYLQWVWWPLVTAAVAYLPAIGWAGAQDACTATGGTASLMSEIGGRLVPVGLAAVAFLKWAKDTGHHPKSARPAGKHPRRARWRLPATLAALALGTGGMACLTNALLQSHACKDGQVDWALYVTLQPPLLLLGLVIGNLLFVGISSRVLQHTDREWLSRHEGVVLRTAMLWLVVFGAALVLPQWWAAMPWPAGHALLGSAASSGWLLRYGLPMWQARSAASGAGGAAGAAAPPPPRSALSLVSALAPALFIASLVAGLSLLLHALVHSLQAITPEWVAPMGAVPRDLLLVLGSAGLLAALGTGFGWCVDSNKFSLHGMYRDRLVRAYLGASNQRREANVFSGFAPKDDLPMHELHQRPLHVVNTTLNLLKSNRLAWQQRKAQPFSITRLHCGNLDLGYRDAAAYGGSGGINLGTAITISGAAASPSMGAASTPATGFVMAVLNARLGAWLGNPGDVGDATWKLKSPPLAVMPLAREALGLTSNDSPFVYLSDGGHFENLALYEMVLRRCRLVVLLDGGCDPGLQLEDLGNALRKIRIDQGIEIEFAEGHVEALTQRQQRHAVGRIRYGHADGEDGAEAKDGWLLYVKPMLTGNESADIRNYGSTHPTFPHETTANQWFNESQTESYRALGAHSIHEVLAALPPGPSLVAQVEAAWQPRAPRVSPHA